MTTLCVSLLTLAIVASKPQPQTSKTCTGYLEINQNKYHPIFLCYPGVKGLNNTLITWIIHDSLIHDSLLFAIDNLLAKLRYVSYDVALTLAQVTFNVFPPKFSVDILHYAR